MTEDQQPLQRDTKTEGSSSNNGTEGNHYEQNGNFGIGGMSGGEIKNGAEVAAVINKIIHNIFNLCINIKIHPSRHKIASAKLSNSDNADRKNKGYKTENSFGKFTSVDSAEAMNTKISTLSCIAFLGFFGVLLAVIYYFTKDSSELFASDCPFLKNKEYGVFIPYHKDLKRDDLYRYLKQNKIPFVKNCKWYGTRDLVEEEIILPSNLLDMYNKNYKVQKQRRKLPPPENGQTGVLIPGLLDFAAAKQFIDKIQENVTSTKIKIVDVTDYSLVLDSKLVTYSWKRSTFPKTQPVDDTYLPSVVTSSLHK